MRFFCDVMLGGLARHLRILGLDAAYPQSPASGQAVVPAGEDFTCFTRTSRLSGYPRTVVVRADRPKEQVAEVIPVIRPYVDPSRYMTRCIRCNVILEETERSLVEPLVPEFVYHQHDRFRICPHCRRVYWQGSHGRIMQQWISSLFPAGEPWA